VKTNLEDHTSDLLVGARLGAARIKAGISLEKAAKDTRIRVQRLKEIETDDYSGFVHPTYIRLFLIDYANYLGVPQSEITAGLPRQEGGTSEGYQYLDALSSGYRPPNRVKRRPGIRLLIYLGTGLFAFIVSIVVMYFWLAWRKLERVRPNPPPTPSLVVPADGPTNSEATASPTPEATPDSPAHPIEDLVPVEPDPDEPTESAPRAVPAHTP